MDKLQIHISNFRAIEDAQIALNGITVLTGLNATGKSTISRMMYYAGHYASHYRELIDATRGIEAQDANIFRVIQRNNKGLVVCVNKWDLVEDKSMPVQRTMEEAIRARFAPFTDFPIIFISALNKQRILKVIETAQHVYDMRSTRIPTHQLNQVLLPLIEKTPPPSIKGKYIKIKFVHQLPTAVPSFAFYANLPQWVREPYKRFLENQIRKNWDFCGTPINIFLREK